MEELQRRVCSSFIDLFISFDSNNNFNFNFNNNNNNNNFFNDSSRSSLVYPSTPTSNTISTYPQSGLSHHIGTGYSQQQQQFTGMSSQSHHSNIPASQTFSPQNQTSYPQYQQQYHGSNMTSNPQQPNWY